jgi:hypothetical protein
VDADILERVAAQAIRLGAHALEIEYKDGREWVFATSGAFGVGINSFRSSSRDATRLREDCYRISKRKGSHRITVDAIDYELRCAVYDSFGEDAFHIQLRPISKARSRRHPTSQRNPKS